MNEESRDRVKSLRKLSLLKKNPALPTVGDVSKTVKDK